ncbi:MAG: hypothetical protein R3F11_05105 [Verrucomicrobiales bacterium]
MHYRSCRHDHGHDHAHDDHDHHHEQSWLAKYVFSTDHKVIGVQYGVSALIFLAFGFFLMMVMRWTIAYPGEPLLPCGKLFGEHCNFDGRC